MDNFSVNMIGLALSKKILGNDQHVEGLVKKVKSKKNMGADAQEPASWAVASWHEHQIGGKYPWKNTIGLFT